MKTKIPVSVIVLTHNEEQNLKRCLDALNFCDEVIVVDDFSTDQTIKIAEQYGSRIIQRHLDNDFANQRNYAMLQAQNDWILFIDADEIVSDQLQEELILMFNPRNIQFDVFYIKRRDYFWGKELKHGELKKVYEKGLLRFMKKNSGHWEGKVHERFVSNAKIGSLTKFINHFPHQSITEFLNDINIYSSLRAEELQHHPVNIFEIILYPFGKFLRAYFWDRGYADGPAGFVYAFMMSFHSFLVRTKAYTRNVT